MSIDDLFELDFRSDRLLLNERNLNALTRQMFVYVKCPPIETLLLWQEKVGKHKARCQCQNYRFSYEFHFNPFTDSITVTTLIFQRSFNSIYIPAIAEILFFSAMAKI